MEDPFGYFLARFVSLLLCWTAAYSPRTSVTTPWHVDFGDQVTMMSPSFHGFSGTGGAKGGGVLRSVMNLRFFRLSSLEGT